MEDNIDLAELVKPSILTAQHGNGKKRIAEATESLQQAMHQFVELLNDRARLFADSAQFDSALQDAATIRTLLPGSALGYLCTGYVHCQQGCYAAAVAMYDQGLEAVPESDAYYKHLQQHRLTAIANNSKRVDFISRLPLDIVVTNILPRVKPKCYSESSSPCEHLFVSRTWQKRILQQPDGVNFDFGQEGRTFKKGHDELVRCASYVQSLSGAITGEVRLDELFSRARFSNLKQLDLNCAFSIPHRPLLNGLRMIADSLTHLVIDGYPCDIKLRDVLESCPNLILLTTEEVAAVLPSDACYPKIMHLALHSISDTAPSHDHMDDLLSRFPSLVSFQITPMPESSVLALLPKHCPHLQILYFGSLEFDSSKLITHPGRKGITMAEISGEDMYHQDDLIRFLHVHQNSLERIVIDAEVDVKNRAWKLQHEQVIPEDEEDALLCSENDPTQSETSFPQLVDMVVSDPVPSKSQALITRIISNAPNLKSISLPHSHLEEPHIADAMIDLKHLSKLRVTRSKSRNFVIGGVAKFLTSHITRGLLSTLEELTLHANQAMLEVSWIPLVSNLHCLKNLELVSPDISREWFFILKQIGQGCRSLESLKLGTKRCKLVDGSIESLDELMEELQEDIPKVIIK